MQKIVEIFHFQGGKNVLGINFFLDIEKKYSLKMLAKVSKNYSVFNLQNHYLQILHSADVGHFGKINNTFSDSNLEF